MTSWKDRFYDVVAEWLREAKKLPCAHVNYVEHEAYEWDDYSDAHGVSFAVEVGWVDTDGNKHVHRYDGGIEEMLSYA